ncbi:MAG: class I SAM-dependent methyltransferase [Candidatus Acidiferrales bacterium]
MNQLLPARRAHRTSRSRKPALVNSPEEQGALRCRGCSAGGLRTILDLGCLPLANGLLNERQVLEPEPTYPLILVFCSRCALVQITETLPAADLYGQYVYFSSYSDTMLGESRRIAERMIRVHRLDQNSRVIEIASNDGYLLQFYKEAGVSVLGVEPASNVAAAAIGRGIPTVCDFFSPAIAQQLCEEGKRADVIHAHNVLAHVADIHDFFRGLAMLLESEGVIAIEVPYVRDMIEGAEFDTIYHEHLSYFSLSALDRIGELHGLAITGVEHLSIHGGSLRIFMAHAGTGAPVCDSVPRMLDEEQRCGLTSASFYEKFARRVERLRCRLVSHLRSLKSQGARLAAYGASAKGTTLLNFCGIDGGILDFVVDRSPAKHGLYTPGTHLPIYNVEALLRQMPDFVVLLAWNWADEIVEQQAEYRHRGGRFIVPIPELRVI